MISDLGSNTMKQGYKTMAGLGWTNSCLTPTVWRFNSLKMGVKPDYKKLLVFAFKTSLKFVVLRAPSDPCPWQSWYLSLLCSLASPVSNHCSLTSPLGWAAPLLWVPTVNLFWCSSRGCWQFPLKLSASSFRAQSSFDLVSECWKWNKG